MEFKGAIFDLDGTLLDSMHVWNEVDFRFFSSRNIEMPEDYIKTISPMGFYNAGVYSKERFNLSESVEEIIKEWNDIAQKQYASSVKLKDGAREYLDYLKNQGVKLAVATASDEKLFKPCLINNGIYDYFENITTLDEVNRGKGFPDVYEKAAVKMGLSNSDCVVFEDIYLGIKGAKDGNFKAVCMFDKTSEMDREKIKTICDRYIRSFKEMM